MPAPQPGVVTEDGLLLPVRPPGRGGLVLLGLGALLLLVVSAALLGQAVTGRDWRGVVGALVTLAGAALFAGAARGLLRQDRHGSTGLLLTPTGVTLTDRERPVALPWEGIAAVEDTSPLVTEYDDAHPGWLAFRLRAEPEAGLEDELRLMSGSPYPSINAEELVAGTEATRELCRYYLMHPEARGELATPAALERLNVG